WRTWETIGSTSRWRKKLYDALTYDGYPNAGQDQSEDPGTEKRTPQKAARPPSEVMNPRAKSKPRPRNPGNRVSSRARMCGLSSCSKTMSRGVMRRSNSVAPALAVQESGKRLAHRLGPGPGDGYFQLSAPAVGMLAEQHGSCLRGGNPVAVFQLKGSD